MNELGDTMRAAAPPWEGAHEWEMTYRRTSHIQWLSCGDVDSHLYSRMCCSGRCVRAQGEEDLTGSGCWGMLLTLSFTSNKPLGVKSGGSQKAAAADQALK